MAIEISHFRKATQALYGLDRCSNLDVYLSDSACSDATKINHAAAWRLNDKALQSLVFRPFRSHLVTTLGFGEAGVWRTVDSDTPLLEILSKPQRVVSKPRNGASGRDVHILDTGEWKANDLEEGILDHSLILTEWVEQSSYASQIWPQTAGTVRVLTMKPRTGEPFVAAAVHRFGSQRSPFVDNWNQGGLSAAIGPDGVMSAAARQNPNGRAEWHPTHPDTGAAIEGVIVPKWDGIRFLALDMAEWLSDIPYVGWDFIVTDDRVVLLEANADPGVHCLQVHGGLLKSARVRRFYEEHNVKGL